MTAAATPGPSQGCSRPSFADATPAEIRAALIPEEAAEFDQQWREVMAAVLATLDSWRGVARLTAVPGLRRPAPCIAGRPPDWLGRTFRLMSRCRGPRPGWAFSPVVHGHHRQPVTAAG